MTETTANSRAKRAPARPRKWGNRRPAAKRIDLTPEEAERREQEWQAQRRARALHVQVSEAERAMIEARAAAYGMTLSDFIRTVLLSDLKEPPPARTDPDALRRLAFELSKVGTNLNQLAKRANEANKISAEKERRTLLQMESTLTALTAEIAGTLEKVMAL